MEGYKGIVALDIDGTLTQGKHEVDEKLFRYLHTLHEKKWQLVFVTGRNFSFAEPIVSKFLDPYFLVVQNGSLLFAMPEKKMLFSYPLNKNILVNLQELAIRCEVALVVELLIEGEDISIYDPETMPEEEKNYVLYRSTFFRGNWIAKHPLFSYPFQEFLVAKIFGSEDGLKKFSENLGKASSLESILMRDPFRENSHFFYLHSPLASKKNAVLYLQKKFFPKSKIIVAGDDLNDYSLLEIADHAIVMEHAPVIVKNIANKVIGSNPDDLIRAIERGIEH